MSREQKLPFHEKGVQKTKAGHLRYTSPKELRGKYVHRVVVERLIAETPYSIRGYIPYPYEVHHMDWNKENNDPGNFLLLSNAFHSKLTGAQQRVDGKFMGYKPRYTPPAQPLLEFMNDVAMAAEVPF